MDAATTTRPEPAEVAEPAEPVEVDEDLLPTEEDVRFYEEHGWFVTKRILSDALLDEAARAVERFHLGERDREFAAAGGFVDWTPADGGAVRVNEHVAYRNAALHRFVVQPVLGAIAARLARTSEIRLFEDTVIHKDPAPGAGTGATGWHTDDAYSSNCTSRDTLSAWVPLHDVSRERAPLVVLDRSHLWSGTDHLRNFNDQDLSRVARRFAGEGGGTAEVPMVLEKGQVSFHHCRTVHGSYPNRSAEPRTAFAVHLQDGANRYRDFWNDGRPVHHFMDRICRARPDGRPDYTDPTVFPTLWSALGSR